MIGIAAGLVAHAQAPESATFEVVSIKVHPLQPGQFFFRSAGANRIQVQGDRYAEKIITLPELIMTAYGVRDYQVLGVPDWAASARGEHYDIEAKPASVPAEAQLQQMLRNLLADRFQLKLHIEKRPLDVYALVVAKGGSKLRPMRDDEQIPGFATRPVNQPRTLMSDIAGLVSLIHGTVDRPVVDQTGLTGRFEYTNLNWRQYAIDLRSSQPDPDSEGSIFSALQHELGLKLEPRKDPTDVIIVDHAEKPSAN